ncbi:MAG: hypothetical protein J6E43_04830 [Prevotella sp.]|nr:hypothetical protein [Prevotella sp.]
MTTRCNCYYSSCCFTVGSFCCCRNCGQQRFRLRPRARRYCYEQHEQK